MTFGFSHVAFVFRFELDPIGDVKFGGWLVFEGVWTRRFMLFACEETVDCK